VSNIQRHSSRSTIVINHDGRHLPKVPLDGFDKILVDAPCTGSATTRKNPEVWGKWSPQGGRSLHDLQISLLRKAVSLVKPGGRVVYSTCSLDPIENEAVVAEIIRTEENLELLPVSEILPNLPGRHGFSSWPDIDDEAEPSTNISLQPSMTSPVENEISESLKRCMRIWHDDVGGGGFFISVIQKSRDLPAKPQDSKFYKSPDEVNPDIKSSPQPISKEMSNRLDDRWGSMPDNLWMRGKMETTQGTTLRQGGRQSQKGGARTNNRKGGFRSLILHEQGNYSSERRYNQLLTTISITRNRGNRNLRGNQRWAYSCFRNRRIACMGGRESNNNAQPARNIDQEKTEGLGDWY
jgi:hypothetical protein